MGTLRRHAAYNAGRYRGRAARAIAQANERSRTGASGVRLRRATEAIVQIVGNECAVPVFSLTQPGEHLRDASSGNRGAKDCAAIVPRRLSADTPWVENRALVRLLDGGNMRSSRGISSADEALKTGVDHGHRGASRHRLHRKDSRRQSDGGNVDGGRIALGPSIGFYCLRPHFPPVHISPGAGRGREADCGAGTAVWATASRASKSPRYQV